MACAEPVCFFFFFWENKLYNVELRFSKANLFETEMMIWLQASQDSWYRPLHIWNIPHAPVNGLTPIKNMICPSIINHYCSHHFSPKSPKPHPIPQPSVTIHWSCSWSPSASFAYDGFVYSPRCHGVVLEVVATGTGLIEVWTLLITTRHQQADAIGSFGRIPHRCRVDDVLVT